jgi:hypothetical protein
MSSGLCFCQLTCFVLSVLVICLCHLSGMSNYLYGFKWGQALKWLFPCLVCQKFGKKDVHITVDSGRDTLVPLIPKQRRGSCNQSWGTYRVMAAVATVTVVCAGVCLVLVHPNEVIQLSTSLHHRLWGQWHGCIFSEFSSVSMSGWNLFIPYSKMVQLLVDNFCQLIKFRASIQCTICSRFCSPQMYTTLFGAFSQTPNFYIKHVQELEKNGMNESWPWCFRISQNLRSL